MNNLDPFAIPLESINLIEASAGTGKSWTVTLLYLRLILEKNLTVDQILVVTFTDAATKELRDNIRNRLIDALLAFEADNYEKDDEYRTLLANITDKKESIRRLNRAKLSLDEAAIFTIHSFCQRSLSENAFESGLPFESELMDDDRELMQQLTDDFWRRNFFSAPPALLFKLKQKSITPETLLNDIYTAVGKPYLELYEPENESVNDKQWIDHEDCFKQAIRSWKENREEVIALLDNPELDNAYMKALMTNRDDAFSLIDQYACLECSPCNVDTKANWLGEKEKTKAKFDSIEHPFFKLWQSFLDSLSTIDQKADEYINHIRIRLLKHLQINLPKEKLRLGVLSFDDLLLYLQKALRENPQLALSLRTKYSAALIDEFQDTDPIQYEIFRKIFTDKHKTFSHAVFLVGDPKQAIYSFRGGDIHTYLKAKSDIPTRNHYTLETNWRSHPKLISAFNSLYSSSENPFKDTEIKYNVVNTGTIISNELITPDNRKPLSFWKIEIGEEKKSIAIIREEIAIAVAGDIAQLLNSAQKDEARIGEKAVTGGDIAILIRSHTEGDLIKQALNNKGIPSVQSSKESIFQTHEASEIYRLLTAIADPQYEDNIRRALITELMAYNAADLLAFESNSNEWEKKLSDIQRWHDLWKQKGFLPMIRDLMKTEKMHQRLLAYNDGERRLTNVLHLAEIIHKQGIKQSLSMEEVLRWLQQQQQNTSSKEAELRLESDDELVKIVTIHKSKGLEYPIVYCPFVGLSGKDQSSNIFIFHQNEKACLEIGSANAAEYKKIKVEEERAENTRLLYVALTRAKYQCTVVCVPEAISRSPDKSALGWLLTDGMIIQSAGKGAKENNEKYYQKYIEQLTILSQKNTIDLKELPIFEEDLRYQPFYSETVLTARHLINKNIDHKSQMTSFSKLTSGAHVETPDYDAESIKGTQTNSVDGDFPRGSTAGTALHEMFENLDFETSIIEQSNIILKTLDRWSFDVEYEQSAVTLIEKTLQSELFVNFSLQKLNKAKRLDEMEFYLPLNSLQMDDLRQILFKHLPIEWQVVRNAVKTLYFEQVEGYLKGYIDLIFEDQEMYYVVDYKSNSLADYSQEALLETIANSHYYLQYLLYSVALHRYLKTRVPNYSWETHIGGVYYLFIRGMQGYPSIENKEFKEEKTSKTGGGGFNMNSSDNVTSKQIALSDDGNYPGVFFHKPNIELIEAIDGLFVESFI